MRDSDAYALAHIIAEPFTARQLSDFGLDWDYLVKTLPTLINIMRARPVTGRRIAWVLLPEHAPLTIAKQLIEADALWRLDNRDQKEK